MGLEKSREREQRLMNNNRLVKIILENAPEVLKAQKSLHLCSKSPRVSRAENPRVLFSFNPHLHGRWTV